jgi:MFS family permease
MKYPQLGKQFFVSILLFYIDLIIFRLQSIPYTLTVCIVPLLGLLIDWIGHRTSQLILSIFLLIIAHGMIYLAVFGAFLPLILIGISFSVFGSVIWACVPLIVLEENHGTAYGIMTAFQNTAQCLIPLVLQQIYRTTESYRSCEIFLAGFSCLGLFIAILLMWIDEVYGRGQLRIP